MRRLFSLKTAAGVAFTVFVVAVVDAGAGFGDGCPPRISFMKAKLALRRAATRIPIAALSVGKPRAVQVTRGGIRKATNIRIACSVFDNPLKVLIFLSL